MTTANLDKKRCKECNTFLFINSWNGWFWECIKCGKVYEQATLEEVIAFEKELEEENKK